MLHYYRCCFLHSNQRQAFLFSDEQMSCSLQKLPVPQTKFAAYFLFRLNLKVLQSVLQWRKDDDPPMLLVACYRSARYRG